MQIAYIVIDMLSETLPIPLCILNGHFDDAADILARVDDHKPMHRNQSVL